MDKLMLQVRQMELTELLRVATYIYKTVFCIYNFELGAVFAFSIIAPY